jgi:hypothetical protein
MERMGILLIGVAALIYTSAYAYININYMHMTQTGWEQIP